MLGISSGRPLWKLLMQDFKVKWLIWWNIQVLNFFLNYQLLWIRSTLCIFMNHFQQLTDLIYRWAGRRWVRSSCLAPCPPGRSMSMWGSQGHWWSGRHWGWCPRCTHNIRRAGRHHPPSPAQWWSHHIQLLEGEAIAWVVLATKVDQKSQSCSH